MQKKYSLLQQITFFKITFGLIALNVIAYCVAAFMSGSLIDLDMQVLVRLGALFGPITVVHGQWQNLLTAMFLHGGMIHLLMNMFALYLIGRGVEQYFNTASYLGIYFFSGIIGGLVSLYVHPEAVGIGASGAIFGIFGALAGFFLAHRDKIQSHTKAFMKDFAVILGINLLLGFSIESIDVSAHVAGLLVGLLGGYMISKNPKLLWIYSIMMCIIIVGMMNYLPTQYAQRLF